MKGKIYKRVVGFSFIDGVVEHTEPIDFSEAADFSVEEIMRRLEVDREIAQKIKGEKGKEDV